MTASLSNGCCCCAKPPGTEKNKATVVPTTSRNVQRFAATKTDSRVIPRFIQCLAPKIYSTTATFFFRPKNRPPSAPDKRREQLHVRCMLPVQLYFYFLNDA